jgi:hypothetical protein
MCTHVAEGHSRAVLSVFATDDLLFSASRGELSLYPSSKYGYSSLCYISLNHNQMNPSTFVSVR